MFDKKQNFDQLIERSITWFDRANQPRSQIEFLLIAIFYVLMAVASILCAAVVAWGEKNNVKFI